MKQKISYARIIALSNFASPLLQEKKEENRLITSLKSVFKQITKESILEDYNEKVKELRIKNALTDPTTKALLRDDKGGFMFSPEGQSALNKGLADLLKEEVEINVRHHDDNVVIVKRDYNYFEQQIFEGFVIPEETEEAAN
jgi:phage pi2 protein 07